MASMFTLDRDLELNKIAAYHRDVLSSLRLYFSSSSPTFAAQFAGNTEQEVRETLGSRIGESDIRSTFATLTSLEAHFRIDFEFRCKNKKPKDALTDYFRNVKKNRKEGVRLDEDILEGWKEYTDVKNSLIGDLRGAFNFRHWVAHGRYWTPKLGRKYDFNYVQLMAEAVVASFSLNI